MQHLASFLVCFLYGWFLLVAVTNLGLMRRPTRRSAPVSFEVMVPARDEERNLPNLVPTLVEQGVSVTVFDDQSTDATAETAAMAGATVVRPEGPLPAGWTGKNRACHALAQRAQREWTVFLDADTRPSPDFAGRLSALLEELPGNTGVVTGFLEMRPGRGLEPAYLGWVSWVLLASNPFGLVSLTGFGHNGFTNGQFAAWRTSLLQQLGPYEAVRGEILEDVKIGRLLASRGIRAEVLDASAILSVRMYADLREAWEGMSKNSGEIGGSVPGSLAFAGLLLVAGWGWAFTGPLALPLYLALVASKLLTDLIAKTPAWPAILMPVTCTAAAVTVLRSLVLKARGRVAWKGRTYGP